MAKKDYLPAAEDQLVVWAKNFITKFAPIGVSFGFTAGEISALQADVLLLEAAVDYAEASKQDTKEVISFKDLELYGPVGSPTPTVPAGSTPIALSPRAPGIVPRIRAAVARIKSHPNYTDAIGQDLGIIGPEAAPPLTVKPTGRVLVSGPHEATVEFRKAGFDGVLIESRRAGETAYTFLAIDTYSPFVDNRPLLVPGQPETREYRMRYRKGDEAVGEYSDVMSVVVGG